MLTDGHHPDGFNQRVAGIPCVNNQTGLSESSLGHCSSAEDNKTHSELVLIQQANPFSKNDVLSKD